MSFHLCPPCSVCDKPYFEVPGSWGKTCQCKPEPVKWTVCIKTVCEGWTPAVFIDDEAVLYDTEAEARQEMSDESDFYAEHESAVCYRKGNDWTPVS